MSKLTILGIALLRLMRVVAASADVTRVTSKGVMAIQ